MLEWHPFWESRMWKENLWWNEMRWRKANGKLKKNIYYELLLVKGLMVKAYRYIT